MIETFDCPYCKRTIKETNMSLHHIKPKCLGGGSQDTVYICKSCHQLIHYVIDINEVEQYDSLEHLLTIPLFNKYIKFMKNVKHGKIWKFKYLLQKIKSA